MKRVQGLGVLVSIGVSLTARAAEPPDQPKVLFIEKEEIKPGKMRDHEATVAKYKALFSKAGSSVSVLTLAPVAGNENAHLFLFPHPSWASLEAQLGEWEKLVSGPHAAEMAAIDKGGSEQHAAQKAMVAVYQPDLSYRPRGGDVAKTRFLFVTTLHVNAGRVAQWREDVKWATAATEKAGIDRHWSVYAVAAGADLRTFLRFEAVRSLAEADAYPDIAKAVRASLDAEGQKRWDEMGRETSPEGSTSLWAFVPSLSSLPKQWAEKDPEFWTPKAAGPAAAKPKKR